MSHRKPARRISRRRNLRNAARVHRNKYAHLRETRALPYDAQNKRFRSFIFVGTEGQIEPEGRIMIYHGRRYRLRKQIIIPASGFAFAEFELVGYI